MEKIKNYASTIVFIFAVCIIGSIGYWIGNRNTDVAVENKTRELQSKISTMQSDINANIERLNAAKSELAKANNYITELRKQTDAIVIDAKQLTSTGKHIADSVDGTIGKIRERQTEFEQYKDGF